MAVTIEKLQKYYVKTAFKVFSLKTAPTIIYGIKIIKRARSLGSTETGRVGCSGNNTKL